MSQGNGLSQKASELVLFFDDQGCLGVSELIKWLDSEKGKQVRLVGTPFFGIRHKFMPEMTAAEKRTVYATYKNPFYLGSMSGEKRPIDTLDEIKAAIANVSIQGKQELDHFCLELLETMLGRNTPETGTVLSALFDP